VNKSINNAIGYFSTEDRKLNGRSFRGDQFGVIVLLPNCFDKTIILEDNDDNAIENIVLSADGTRVDSDVSCDLLNDITAAHGNFYNLKVVICKLAGRIEMVFQSRYILLSSGVRSIWNYKGLFRTELFGSETEQSYINILVALQVDQRHGHKYARFISSIIICKFHCVIRAGHSSI